MLKPDGNAGRRWRGAGVACCAWACLLGALAGCDNRQELTRTESEKEANKIIVELTRSGIGRVEKETVKEQRKSSYAIKVQPADLAKAREILLATDLPRAAHGGYKAMTEQGGLIPTKTEERAKLMYAMSEELAHTFETYDRVVSARVHVVVPEKDPLRRDTTVKQTSSATVLIKYNGLPPDAADAPAAPRPGTPADPYADAPVKALEVQQIVAKSVEGVSPEAVYVAFSRSTPVAPAPPGATTGDTGASEGDRKLMIQVLGVAVLFGVISIFLTYLLVKEKRRRKDAEGAVA